MASSPASVRTRSRRPCAAITRARSGTASPGSPGRPAPSLDFLTGKRAHIPCYDALLSGQRGAMGNHEHLIWIDLEMTGLPVSYTHLRAHETGRNLVCRLL